MKLGFLAPGRQELTDYPRMAAAISPAPEVVIQRTATVRAFHRPDDLRLTGKVESLLEAAGGFGLPFPDVVMWACTSCSFIFGRQGAEEQATRLELALGVPCSSTSLAFVDVLTQLGVESIGLVSPYPSNVTDALVSFLGQYGIITVRSHSLGMETGYDSYELKRDDLLPLVVRIGRGKPDAVVVPDTAIQTVEFIEDLEAAAGKMVVTANQVTFLRALQLAEGPTAARGLGLLFASRRLAP